MATAQVPARQHSTGNSVAAAGAATEVGSSAAAIAVQPAAENKGHGVQIPPVIIIIYTPKTYFTDSIECRPSLD